MNAIDGSGAGADSGGDAEARGDPYAHWASATRGEYLSVGASERLRLALRLREGVTLQALTAELPQLIVPPIYGQSLLAARWCTAQAAFSDPASWQRLSGMADWLLAEPGSWRPDRDRAPAAEPIGPASGKGSGPVVGKGRIAIGVIDGACGFANRRFRERVEKGKNRRWQTRIAAYWDQQTAASGTRWQRPDDLGYGRELIPAELDRLFQRHLDTERDDDEAQARGERAVYGELGVALPAVADWSHGTHVLDTVGGSPTPVRARQPAPDEKDLPSPTGEVGAAALICVQLPEPALLDTSGRCMPACVLDGLRYIVARAKDADAIVVNLSLGSFAGPHDGSSMIEQAIDAMVEELAGQLTVVVAAGNARQPRNDGDGTIRCCHAEAELATAGDPGDTVTLLLRIDEADATESFVEVWLPDAPVDDKEAAAVTVELCPPGSTQAGVTAPAGRVRTWRDVQGTALAQVVNLSGRGGPGARGKGPMALVAVGATRDVVGHRAPPGVWRIVVRNESAAPVSLCARVERRDIPGELPGERPQYGFDPEEGVALQQTDNLGSLANGARTIVVAGAEFVVGKNPRLMRSSSLGPARPRGMQGAGTRPGPVVAAACEFACTGFLTGSEKTLKGTSMSAARVTRTIAAEALLRAPLGVAGLRQWMAAGLRDWLRGLASPPAARSGGPTPQPRSYIVLLP